MNALQPSAKARFELTGGTEEIADRIEAALTRIAAARGGRDDTARRLRELEVIVERSIGDLDQLLAAQVAG